jgi:hypothetical protein
MDEIPLNMLQNTYIYIGNLSDNSPIYIFDKNEQYVAFISPALLDNNTPVYVFNESYSFDSYKKLLGYLYRAKICFRKDFKHII